ncbi:MAG: helicase HerA-like domain-containing protein [Lachnospiraceae bacterium]|jgi:DNA helicase HerA-like ATPase
MIKDGKIWLGSSADGSQALLLPKMANRHGLVAGATGTGKTVTLKVLAESFSRLGVPVFMADVKGDVTGIMEPGTDTPKTTESRKAFGLDEAGFAFRGCPVTIWDLFGKTGIPLRTTISDMGPLLLSRILGLNDLQSDILSIVFHIADENNLLLIDTKDLKSMLGYVKDHAKDFEEEYGRISSASIGAITRAVVALEIAGGDTFFGEPALAISDWLTRNTDGYGMVNLLDSRSLIGNPSLYSTFLLWLISELFETLPEVGDCDLPKMVFFFDEAHLLFQDTPKVLQDKIEQVVKLIRSKGVGIFFCTQNPRDIPDGILSQLSTRIEHGLHAYTPADQKAVKAAAESFRVNPAFDTYETILALGTGEAVVSLPDEDGVPGMAQKVTILPPQCSMSAAPEGAALQCVKSSLLFSKYSQTQDPESAYEKLEQQEAEEARQAEATAAAAAEAKEQAKKTAAEEKARKKEEESEDRKRKKAIGQVGSTLAGTVGREVGKNIGKKFGSFGRTLGGNVGASIGRGLLNTLLKR